MGSLAAQAAIALENARLYSETSRRLTETRALLEVAEILNSTLDSRALLKRVTLKVAQVCRVDRCTLELWDGDQRGPAHVAVRRRPPDAADVAASSRRGRARPPAAIPANAQVIETRQPLRHRRLRDVAAASRASGSKPSGCAACLIVPMLRQERVHRRDDARLLRPARALPGLAAGPGPGHRRPARARAGEHAALRRGAGAPAGDAHAAGRRPGRSRSRDRPTSSCAAWPPRWAARSAPTWSASTWWTSGGETLVPAAGYHVPKDLIEFFRSSRSSSSGRRRCCRRVARRAGGVEQRRPGRRRASTRTGRRRCRRTRCCSRRRWPTASRSAACSWCGGAPGRAFPPAEVRLLEGIAAQVGLAMENVELARQTQIKLAETETLLSVSRAVSSTLDVAEPGAPLPAPGRHHVRRRHRRPVDGGRDGPVADAARRLPRAARAAGGAARACACRSWSTRSTPRRPRTRRAGVLEPTPPTIRGMPPIIREQAPHRSHLFVPVVAKDRMIGGFAVVWWRAARDFSAERARPHGGHRQPGRRRHRERAAVRARTGGGSRSCRSCTSCRARSPASSIAPRCCDALRAQLGARPRRRATWSSSCATEDGDELEVVLRIVDGERDDSEPRRYPAPRDRAHDGGAGDGPAAAHRRLRRRVRAARRRSRSPRPSACATGWGCR